MVNTWHVVDGDCDPEVFIAVLDKEDDTWTAPGGLRLTDTETGTTIVPGNHVGLEDWRLWTDALAGESPWLGSDPPPRIEFLGERLLVWQGRGGPCVTVPRAELPGMLLGVRRDLQSFLVVLERSCGPDFAAHVDRDFQINGRLGWDDAG